MKNKHNSFDEIKGKFIFVDFKYLNKLSKTLFIIFGLYIVYVFPLSNILFSS